MAVRRGFSAGGMAARIAFAVALVLATWNPSHLSFVDLALDHLDGATSMVALAGVLLLIVWVIYLRATLRAIGAPGMALAGGLVAALIWVLSDFGILDLTRGAALAWTGLVGLGVVLGIGLSWSHVRRALSGQGDVDDVGD